MGGVVAREIPELHKYFMSLACHRKDHQNSTNNSSVGMQSMKRSKTENLENNTKIEYMSETIDNLGRCRFFLNWHDGQRKRSQVFFADPREYGHKRPEECSSMD